MDKIIEFFKESGRIFRGLRGGGVITFYSNAFFHVLEQLDDF